MNHFFCRLVATLLTLLSITNSHGQPLKVFILAGQSNMEGHGNVPLDAQRIVQLKERGHYERDKRNYLQFLAHDAEDQQHFHHLLTREKEWVVRDDVWFAWNRDGHSAKEFNTRLTVGLGASERQIGPELMFGHIMGNYFDEPVLLIKTAWGGKSLAVDFRPPSAGMPPDDQLQARLDKINEQRKKKNQDLMSQEELRAQYGHYYRMMLADIDHTLKTLKQRFPAYDEKTGYELSGFAWFQGWNDGGDLKWAEEYASNFKHFVRDIRAKYGPLPVVIGTSGFGKNAPSKHDGWVNRLREQVEPRQITAAKEIEQCIAFETGDCLIPHPDRTSNRGIHHWFNSAETYYLIGEGMGKAMRRLLEVK